MEYQKQLMAIKLKTSLGCFDLIYANALIGELSKRVGHSQSIAKSYQVKFEQGETNILEYNKAMSLPKLQTGYMSESVVGQQFQGVTVGLTIPLWENKNKVKSAEANSQALESIAADSKIQFYNHLKALHTKTIALQKNVNEYRSGVISYDSSELLKKALDKEEISSINYITEFSLYYESVNKLLELERDMNKSMAELNRYM